MSGISHSIGLLCRGKPIIVAGTSGTLIGFQASPLVGLLVNSFVYKTPMGNNVVTKLYQDSGPGTAVFAVDTGLSNPGINFFQFIRINGVTLFMNNATFSRSGNDSIWTWASSSFGFTNGNQYDGEVIG